MTTVKVVAIVTCIGLKAGQQAELELTDKVYALCLNGFLKILKPKAS